MFGKYVREERLKAGFGLREFCRRLGEDASNWSKVEREVLAPPQDEEKLKRIATILGFFDNPEKWEEFKDMASVDAGIIPKDIRSDEEVLKALPMFFRTVRSEKPSAEELDRLIKKMRER